MTFRQFLGVVELRTKVVSLSTVTLALLYALYRGISLDPLTTAVAALSTLAVDMATTAFNSFFDWWRGGDRRESNREADKVLVHEGVPGLAALLVALGLYVAAACGGIVLALRAGAWVIPAGGLCLFVGFLYSGGPMPISHTPLGEPVAGGFLGTFLFLILFRLEGGPWDPSALLASLPGAAMIAAVLAVNNACDHEADAAAGRRSLAVLAGQRVAKRLVWSYCGLAFGLACAFAAAGILPWPVAAGMVAVLPPAAFRLRAMSARGFGSATKSANMGGIVGVLALWSLGMAAGLALAVVFGLGR
jgi:1,4-dihydroxy-2-naphthoate octaprenyltransferase